MDILKYILKDDDSHNSIASAQDAADPAPVPAPSAESSDRSSEQTSDPAVPQTTEVAEDVSTPETDVPKPPAQEGTPAHDPEDHAALRARSTVVTATAPAGAEVQDASPRPIVEDDEPSVETRVQGNVPETAEQKRASITFWQKKGQHNVLPAYYHGEYEPSAPEEVRAGTTNTFPQSTAEPSSEQSSAPGEDVEKGVVTSAPRAEPETVATQGCDEEPILPEKVAEEAVRRPAVFVGDGVVKAGVARRSERTHTEEHVVENTSARTSDAAEQGMRPPVVAPGMHGVAQHTSPHVDCRTKQAVCFAESRLDLRSSTKAAGAQRDATSGDALVIPHRGARGRKETQ